MQTTEHNDQQYSIHASGAALVAVVSSRTVQASYQPSQPQVLTEALKAQLAAANQQRRENLYPALVQNLATLGPSSQGNVIHSPSEERAMSLQELATANQARRSRLRESSMPQMA